MFRLFMATTEYYFIIITEKNTAEFSYQYCIYCRSIEALSSCLHFYHHIFIQFLPKSSLLTPCFSISAQFCGTV